MWSEMPRGKISNTINFVATLKDTISPWATSYQRDRRTEVLFCRLCIGHTVTPGLHSTYTPTPAPGRGISTV